MATYPLYRGSTPYNASSSNSTGTTLASHASVANKDGQFVFIRRDSATAPNSVPNGWDLIASDTSTSYGMWLYYRRYVTGDPSYDTWGWASNGKIHAVRHTFGQWGDDEFYTTAVVTAAQDTSPLSVGSQSYEQGGTLLYFASVYNTIVRTYTESSGHTEHYDGGATSSDFSSHLSQKNPLTGSSESGSITTNAAFITDSGVTVAVSVEKYALNNTISTSSSSCVAAGGLSSVATGTNATIETSSSSTAASGGLSALIVWFSDTDASVGYGTRRYRIKAIDGSNESDYVYTNYIRRPEIQTTSSETVASGGQSSISVNTGVNTSSSSCVAGGSVSSVTGNAVINVGNPGFRFYAYGDDSSLSATATVATVSAPTQAAGSTSDVSAQLIINTTASATQAGGGVSGIDATAMVDTVNGGVLAVGLESSISGNASISTTSSQCEAVGLESVVIGATFPAPSSSSGATAGGLLSAIVVEDFTFSTERPSEAVWNQDDSSTAVFESVSVGSSEWYTD